MLLAARRIGVPMVTGSAGDTGTNSRVDRYVSIIKELAAKHRLPPFRLGWFYSEVDRAHVRRKMRAGSPIQGLDGRPNLSESELDATDRIVAMAGVHPYIDLLDKGCDVIIGGRSSDCAIFAAPAIRGGRFRQFPSTSRTASAKRPTTMSASSRERQRGGAKPTMSP